jgi:hypothetical protein
MGQIFNDYPAENVYDYQLQKKVANQLHPGDYGPNPYSPLIGILFRPFARLSFLAAVLLWTGISFFLYLVGLLSLSSVFFRGRPLVRSLIICFGLCFWPFAHFLTSGQIAMIGFFALALAFRDEFQNHPYRGGIYLSICLYKPTLLLLLLPMLVITRRYRTLLGFAIGAAAQAALVTAIQGPSVWQGYLHLLLSFGSAAASRTQQAFTIHSTSYVDLVSFFSVLPGGHSLLGRVILFAILSWIGAMLFRSFWKSQGAGKNAQTLVWAATLTWTLVLNTYVGIWDTTPVVLSLIATIAILKKEPELGLYRWATLLWILILVGSYVSTSLAQSTGVQVLTILFASLGMLQLTALRRMTLTERQLERVQEQVSDVLAPA